MVITIDRPPRTIMEVYKMLPEGTLAELIDGVIYMSPSPVSNHQRVILNLASEILTFAKTKKLGEVFVTPFDVYLDEHSNAVQPDIVFVSSEKSSIVQDHIHGVPDLLVEVLSPGNQKHDTQRKKNLYEKFGVREYWIINPETKEATGYSLSNGSFVELGVSTGNIVSPLLKATFAF